MSAEDETMGKPAMTTRIVSPPTLGLRLGPMSDRCKSVAEQV
jgi:hypothetical protein